MSGKGSDNNFCRRRKYRKSTALPYTYPLKVGPLGPRPKGKGEARASLAPGQTTKNHGGHGWGHGPERSTARPPIAPPRPLRYTDASDRRAKLGVSA